MTKKGNDFWKKISAKYGNEFVAMAITVGAIPDLSKEEYENLRNRREKMIKLAEKQEKELMDFPWED